jgi:hypothetical protein
MQARFVAHAGPLWRDEVNSVNVAVLPSFGEVFAHSHLESFPAAWTAVQHLWIRLGLGTTDEGLRRLGWTIGVGIVGTLWWTVRRLGVPAPLVTLLLLGLSPSLVIYGTQVRGYGLGTLAIAWAAGALWTFVVRPTRWTYLGAQAAALLAAQTYFGNCFLLAALCGAGAVCAWRRGALRLVAGIGAIGLVAALSMAINLPSIRYAMRLSPIEQGSYPLAWYASVLRAAVAPEAPLLAAAWGVTLVLAVVGLALPWVRSAPARPGDDRERALYAGVAAAGGVTGYAAYLSFIQVRTEYWYYLPLLVLLVLACEVGIALLAARVPFGRTLRAAAVAAVGLLVLPRVAATVALRLTNVDLAAAVIAREAGPDDLVVVMPWYCGITFQRYYSGRAPWITLPDFDDHRFHLHGEVAEKMKRGNAAVGPELARIEHTLDAGGRVWIVGAPRAPKPGERVPELPRAPDGAPALRAAPYLEAWELQFGALLRNRARSIEGVTLPDAGAVSYHESLPLVVVEG